MSDRLDNKKQDKAALLSRSTSRPLSFAEIRRPTARIEDLPPSLYPMICTPDKYAHALGMTLEEMNETKRGYETQFRTMQASLTGLAGKEIHRKVCEYRYQYGKSPFVCRQCWSYKPICVCERVDAVLASWKEPVMAPVDVRIQVHHDEWQRPSNTGIVCSRLIKNCRMLLKGYLVHDTKLDELLSDVNVFPVLLWPGKSSEDSDEPPPPVYKPEQILEHASTQRIVLIALDGTWGNARRMSLKFARIPRLALVNDSLGSNWLVDARLRKIGPTGSTDSLCTAQAIVLALQDLGLSLSAGEALCDLTRTKLALTSMFCGKKLRN